MRIPVVDDAVKVNLVAFGSPPVVRWSSKGGMSALPKLNEGLVASQPSNAGCGTIPRVVWTYWQSAPLPLIVDACLRSWHRHLPRYRICLLSPSCLPASLPPLPHGFTSWAPHIQSDWVRLAVLATFGGVWMDATTLLSGVTCADVTTDDGTLCTPLSFAEALNAFDQPDFIGYYNLERTHDEAYPMVENWFIAAPARSVFMMRWWRSFDAMLLPDGRSDINRVISGVTVSDLLQGFNVEPDYFACHAAAQWVMRQHGGKLSLIPAELDAFFEPHSRGWDPERICSWLCDAGIGGVRQTARPLTKLISLLWRPLEERLQRGELHRKSILGELGEPEHAKQSNERTVVPVPPQTAPLVLSDTDAA